MKLKKIIGALALSLVILAGCKKDDVATPSDPVSINPDGTLNIADAAGAFYSIEIKNFDENTGPFFVESQMAFGWVGSYPNIVNAGVIKVNNYELDNYANYYMASSFLDFGDTLFNAGNGHATWSVEGSSSSGVTGFTHTDNAPLPAAPSFTLPAQININNSLTINHSTTGGTAGVLYTLSGANGDTTKYVANTSSSITFSSAEIRSVAESASEVGVSIMPVSYSMAAYGGKKYYFVKQHQYTRVTATL
jgi:hypothetical protein